MRIKFLGTGTSYGVPVIGCECPVCRSKDPRDKRRRTSILIEVAGVRLLIDTPPDLREQCLHFGVTRLDAVLLTHAHADHLMGFDDLRAFSDRAAEPLPVWASPETVDAIFRIFPYIRGAPVPGSSIPEVQVQPITTTIEWRGLRIMPLPVEHGRTETYGFRIDAAGQSLVYIPDCKRMPSATLENARGVEVAVLDGLKRRNHPTHMSFDESYQAIAAIGARQAFITHICHDLSHVEIEKLAPAGVRIPYDGLEYEW